MSLAEAIADPTRKAALTADAIAAVEEEVSGLSGLKGKAIGAGYSSVTKVKPDFVPSNIERMMPMFAPVIDTRLAEARTTGDVPGYFATNADAIAEEMLAITDKRAGEANNKTAVKIYEKLRGSAKDQVANAMPRVAQLADAHG